MLEDLMDDSMLFFAPLIEKIIADYFQLKIN